MALEKTYLSFKLMNRQVVLLISTVTITPPFRNVIQDTWAWVRRAGTLECVEAQVPFVEFRVSTVYH